MEGHNLCLSQGRSEAKDMGITYRDEIKMAEVALKRSIVYELLAHAFGEPEREFFEFLKDGEFSLHIIDALTFYPCLKEGVIPLIREIDLEMRDLKIEDLRENYELIASREKNLLYEGNYHPLFNVFEEMADIAGFYRAFGANFSGERPDHICFELEFMRLLCLLESKALLQAEHEKAEICISSQKKFLSEHLGRWTEDLMEKTAGIPFYGRLCEILERWIEMELELLSVKRTRLVYSQNIYVENSYQCIKEVGYEGIQ
jgi:hypothetical protein